LPSHISQESVPSPIIMKTFVFTFGILALVCQMAASFKIEMIIKPQLELSGEESGVDDAESMQGNEMLGETPMTGGDTAVDATQGTSKPQIKARGQLHDTMHRVGMLENRVAQIEKALGTSKPQIKARGQLHDTMHRVGMLENRVAQIEKALGTSKPQIKARGQLHDTMHRVAMLENRVAQIEKILGTSKPQMKARGQLHDTMHRVAMLENRVAQIEKTLANRRY